MCGITGIALDIKDKQNTKFLDSLKAVFTTLLVNTEHMGRDATGIAVLNPSFNITWGKNGIKASSFVETQQYKELMDAVTVDTKFIIGHCRAATSGASVDNVNNHPHKYGETIGIHHGHVPDFVEKTKGLKLNTDSKCDSEVIFATYDIIRRKMPDWTPQKILKFINKYITDSFGCAMFNKHDGDTLTLFKSGSQLEAVVVGSSLDQGNTLLFNTSWSTLQPVIAEKFRNLWTNKTKFIKGFDAKSALFIKSPDQITLESLK